MAVSFTTEISRAESLYSDFPENILVVPELNGRHENTDVESLALDIEANGQLQPILIRKNDQGQPVLVAGHRRWRAIIMLNQRNPQSPRKILCKYTSVGEKEGFLMTISENRYRKDVSPMCDAVNIERLMSKYNYTEEDVRKFYFPEAQSADEITEATRFVKQRISLIEAGPELAQAVRDKRVKITAAVALSKLSRDQQKQKLAQTGKIKVSDVKAPKAPAASNKTVLTELAEIAVELAQEVLSDHSDWDAMMKAARKVIRYAKTAGVEIPEKASA